MPTDSVWLHICLVKLILALRNIYFVSIRSSSMNWTKISRLVLRSILMIVVVCATFIQWMKFTEENTNISISYVERDVELPSMTFCPFKGSHIQQGNITFATYMKEGILKASEFFSMANQQIYMPGKM